jgi:hypothetical protein
MLKPLIVCCFLIVVMCRTLTAGSQNATRLDDRKTETQKIETLISTVNDLKDATFIRNGKEYDCKAAADHMRTKWSYAGDKIHTAQEFIEQIASKSSQSGKPYLIRFGDGREVKSSEFLTEALDRLEHPATQPSTNPSAH